VLILFDEYLRIRKHSMRFSVHEYVKSRKAYRHPPYHPLPSTPPYKTKDGLPNRTLCTPSLHPHWQSPPAADRSLLRSPLCRNSVSGRGPSSSPVPPLLTSSPGGRARRWGGSYFLSVFCTSFFRFVLKMVICPRLLMLNIVKT